MSTPNTLTPEQEQEIFKHGSAVRELGFLTQIKEAGASDDECRKLMAAYRDQHAKRAAALTNLREVILQNVKGQSPATA